MYAIAIAAVIVWFVRVLWTFGKSPAWEGTSGLLQRFTFLLVVTSCIFSVVNAIQSGSVGVGDVGLGRKDLPNILVLSTDGLNASHMSAYGYQRNTTPFIDGLIQQSLFVQNHFTNNAKSTGSIGAFFSGSIVYFS